MKPVTKKMFDFCFYLKMTKIFVVCLACDWQTVAFVEPPQIGNETTDEAMFFLLFFSFFFHLFYLHTNGEPLLLPLIRSVFWPRAKSTKFSSICEQKTLVCAMLFAARLRSSTVSQHQRNRCFAHVVKVILIQNMKSTNDVHTAIYLLNSLKGK